MRKRTSTLSVLALASLLACGAHAKLAVTTTGTLAFGRFAAGSGGTIRVDVNGARSRSGGVVLLASPSSAASFTMVDRNPTSATDIVILSLPPDGSVSLTAGVHSMALTGFVSDRPSGGVLGSGNQIVRVGATLQVGANQAPGNYSGSFPIIVEYQ